MIAPPAILAPNGRPARRELANFWSYDAAEYNTKRRLILAPVQDADKDLDPYSRLELVKHSKDLWRNSPLIRGLFERLVTFTIGTGLIPICSSSSPEWNTLGNRSLRAWSKRCVLNRKWSFGQYQRVIARTRLIQGECFSLKTNSRAGRPRVQGFPTHRVKSGPDGTREGIRYDAEGSPKTFYLDLGDGKDPRPEAAENIVHHCATVELDQQRGEPILASAINTSRDVNEILGMEKEAVKEASSRKDVIQTRTGELETDEEDLMRLGAAAGVTDEQRAAYYQKRFGAESITLKWGDEYKPLVHNRPGPAWTGFMEFLANTICISANVPPSVILPIKLGGVADRRDLASAGRTFEVWQYDLACEFQELAEYVLEAEIEDGPLVNPPADWQNIAWQYPRHITGDAGRQAAADREDVALALMSRQEYWGIHGQNSDEQEDVIIAEAVRRKAKLDDAKLTLEEFVKLTSLDSKLFAASKPVDENDLDEKLKSIPRQTQPAQS